MNDLEKAKEISDIYMPDTGFTREDLYDAAMEMAQWKDEQLESKLMQIIILAQQGYTSGATDEMILLHCKKVIKEQF